MLKLLSVVLLGTLLLTGCQPKEAEQETTTAGTEVATQRKEAARQLIGQAVTLLGQKDYQGALKSLDAAIKFDPTNQESYFILGQLLLKSGENQRAAEFLDTAVKNFPENATFFYMLGIANQLNGKKLPAALAIRRSFELFKAAGDQENAQKSAVLLQQIINTPDVSAPKTDGATTKDDAVSKK